MELKERYINLDLDAANVANTIKAEKGGGIIYIRGGKIDDKGNVSATVVISGMGNYLTALLYSACDEEKLLFDLFKNIVADRLKSGSKKEKEKFIKYINGE